MAFCTMLLLAGLASAGPHEPDPALEREILERDRDREMRVVWLKRFRVSHPQELSGSIGAMFARQPVDYGCTGTCEYRGLLVQAEPGTRGASVSAGYAVVTADRLRRKHFPADIHLGYGVKGVVLRTWDGADLEPETQTLLGAEGDFTVIGINFSLGLFRPISPGQTEDDWVVGGGIGWGF